MCAGQDHVEPIRCGVGCMYAGTVSGFCLGGFHHLQLVGQQLHRLSCSLVCAVISSIVILYVDQVVWLTIAR